MFDTEFCYMHVSLLCIVCVCVSASLHIYFINSVLRANRGNGLRFPGNGTTTKCNCDCYAYQRDRKWSGKIFSVIFKTVRLGGICSPVYYIISI